MLSPRQLLGAAGLALLLVACVDRITYVDRPVTVPGPLRVDTVVQQHPETTIVQLPGRVDTVITRTPPETTLVQLPPRVDTVIKTRVDTLILTTHDTVVVHDTTIHVDTVILRVRSWLCIFAQRGDTSILDRKNATADCDVARLAALPVFAGHLVKLEDSLHLVVGEQIQLKALQLTETTRERYRAPLILPTWRGTH